MKFYELLSDEFIILDFKAKDKQDAIEKMVNHFVNKGRIKEHQRKPIVDALTAREKLASTAVEKGIAFPHASSETLEQLLALLAVSPVGVPFQASDGKNSHIFALLLVPKKEVGKHARTLASIANVLSIDDLRTRILNSTSPREIYEMLKAEEL
jgi:mannitol/fructose-specific phosphotransferase system IIA component (Ntr-type)